MRALVTAALLASALIASSAVAEKSMTDEQKTFYAIGVKLTPALKAMAVTPEELEFVKEGLSDALLGRELKIDPVAQEAKVQELAKDRITKVMEKDKAAGEAFAEKAAAEKGAVKKESGLVYRELVAGKGAQPKATDAVKVHYHGTLIDGTVFDSSVNRGEPVTFPLTGVIPCWTEGVALMKVGGKSKLTCPPSIAYGDRGHQPLIKPGATLTFEVELLEVTEVPQPAPATEKPSEG